MFSHFDQSSYIHGISRIHGLLVVVCAFSVFTGESSLDPVVLRFSVVCPPVFPPYSRRRAVGPADESSHFKDSGRKPPDNGRPVPGRVTTRATSLHPSLCGELHTSNNNCDGVSQSRSVFLSTILKLGPA